MRERDALLAVERQAATKSENMWIVSRGPVRRARERRQRFVPSARRGGAERERDAPPALSGWNWTPQTRLPDSGVDMTPSTEAASAFDGFVSDSSAARRAGGRVCDAPSLALRKKGW